jgi:hypothetical protein
MIEPRRPPRLNRQDFCAPKRWSSCRQTCAPRKMPTNHYSIPRRLSLLLTAFALALHLGCSPEKPASLRVGINPWPTCEPMKYPDLNHEETKPTRTP